MPGPRKPKTKALERSRRQFFQWYFVERLTLLDVKERMDKLSEVLRRVTGDDFVAPFKDWESRRRHWNTLSPTKWDIKNDQRGNPDLPIPADIVDLPLWQKGDKDVGNWRSFQLHNENK
ncbi:hypothetical protein ABVK25_010694 [Lepraria finkii]|uniref:Uncharacterized protein n=1 Tax=Lepraria finkii TaxID=1340010 RepID=A0ABR4AV58_9LECA